MFIINAKQNISDKYDENILLPDNMPDAFDFEYMKQRTRADKK